MKRMLIAFMLACALCGTALAGDMPGVGAATSSGTNTNLVTTVLITIITTLTGQ